MSGINSKKKSLFNKEILLIIFCFLAYTISYVTRYSYNANVNPIIDFYSIDKTQFGIVGTCFFAAYGVGQFLNAFLCKKYNKRIIIPLALSLSSLLNLTLFFQPPFEIYKYLWLINGAILSILWPTLIQILAENISQKYLKLSVIMMSITVAIGTFIVYGFSAIFNAFNIYQYIFLLAIILGVLMALVWLFSYPKLIVRDKPLDIKKETDIKNDAVRNKTSSKSFFVAILIAMGFLMAICNLTKDGITTWVPNILKDSFDLSDSISLVFTLVLPVFGVFGTVFAVFVNSKFKNYMSSSLLLFSITMMAIGLIILGLDHHILALALIMFGVISLMMHGINNLLSNQAPLELRDKISGGTLGGILNGCGYVGSTVSSFGLGALSDSFGWNGVFIFLLIICGVSAFIALVFIFIIRKK